MECSRVSAEHLVTREKWPSNRCSGHKSGWYLADVRTSLMTTEEAELRLQASVSGLAERAPGVSARRILTRRQRQVGIAAIVVVLAGLTFETVVTVSILVSIITVFYVGAIVYRLAIFRASNRPDTTEVVSDDEARAVPDEELPIYTVMIPAYREPEVIKRTDSTGHTVRVPAGPAGRETPHRGGRRRDHPRHSRGGTRRPVRAGAGATGGAEDQAEGAQFRPHAGPGRVGGDL